MPDFTDDELALLIGLLSQQAIQIGAPGALEQMHVATTTLDKLREAAAAKLESHDLDIT